MSKETESSVGIGANYPAFVTGSDGVPMPLVREQRWSRVFRHPVTGAYLWVSRFMDGSATITLRELAAEWESWSDSDRAEFAQSARWLDRHDEFPEILRYMMRHGSAAVWSACALSIAAAIPSHEAIAFFQSALQAVDVADGTNIEQALALTDGEAAVPALRERLERNVSNPLTWTDSPLLNRLAIAAFYEIKHIIELEDNGAEFEPLVRRFAEHPSVEIRRFFRSRLSATYPWLAETDSTPEKG